MVVSVHLERTEDSPDRANIVSGVLAALLAPLGADVSLNAKPVDGSQSSTSSPTGQPHAAVDVLNSILASKGNKFPSELRTNACTLVIALLRDTNSQQEEIATQQTLLKEAVQSTLNSIITNGDALTEAERSLKDAAKRALSVM